MTAGAGPIGLPVQVRIVDLKIHHHVPLEAFDHVVAAFTQQGGRTPVRLDAEARFGMRICDFGLFDVVGLDEPSAHDLPPSITVQVEGLHRVIDELRRQRLRVVRELQRDEIGWGVVVEDANGLRVEYREHP